MLHIISYNTDTNLIQTNIHKLYHHPNSKSGDNDIVDLTSETNPMEDKNKEQNNDPTLILYDSTVTESSPDNMHEVVHPEDNNENKKQETMNGNIQRKIKKSIAHDSTMRKSYRAGIINSIGSNSSLDKDIQQQIAIEQMQAPDSDITNTIKRKLSFGTNSNKRKLSTVIRYPIVLGH